MQILELFAGRDAEHYKEVKQKYPTKKLPKPYK